MEVTFLGTGTSHGIPVVACDCSICRSDKTKNNRYRSSVYIKTDKCRFIIDAATEFRLQAVREGINYLDFILITHAHADHVHGIDDLRTLTRKRKLNVYANKEAVDDMAERFSYIHRSVQKGGGLPDMDFIKMDNPLYFSSKTKDLTDTGISEDLIIPIPVKHGNLDIYGYRIGDFAYITDCSFIPEESMDLLKGIKVLTLGALRYRKHVTHFNIDQAVDIFNRTDAEKGFLTHFCHDIDHDELENYLPENISPAFDTMKLYI